MGNADGNFPLGAGRFKEKASFLVGFKGLLIISEKKLKQIKQDHHVSI